MAGYRDEMAKCVWDLQNRLITNLLKSFSPDLWNKVGIKKLIILYKFMHA